MKTMRVLWCAAWMTVAMLSHASADVDASSFHEDAGTTKTGASSGCSVETGESPRLDAALAVLALGMTFVLRKR